MTLGPRYEERPLGRFKRRPLGDSEIANDKCSSRHRLLLISGEFTCIADPKIVRPNQETVNRMTIK